MSEDLSDFFKILAEEKKQKKSEFNSLVGDLNLNDVFSEVSNFKKIEKQKKVQEDKNKKNQVSDIIGDISLDNLFEEVKTLKKISKQEKKKKKEKEKKALEAFETFLFDDNVTETKEVQNAIEEWIEEVAEENAEIEQPIQKDITEDTEDTDEIIEDEVQEIVQKDIKEEKTQNDPLTPLNKEFVTFKDLSQHYSLFINRIQQQLSTLGGSGETRFEFLDDIDRNSTKNDGYVIQYSSTEGKFIGTSTSALLNENFIIDAGTY